jgi:endoglycosylceramidase
VTAKIAEAGFKPFHTQQPTPAASLKLLLKERTGANAIRFLISWEGTNPEVDQIDAAYLEAITAQIREAVALKMYVLVDWHQDLFSRHLFNYDSWHTGNGAPLWVTKDQGYPKEYCGIICASWGQHNLTDEAVRRGFRNFWNNAAITTPAGTRRMQDAFLWQMDQTLQHLKANLTEHEFAYIMGVDPVNEPVDGGMEGLSPAQWDNQKLWPFYRKVRAMMDNNGWYNKPVYAEPLVFWNTNVGFVAPATGGHHLTDIPARGFVFNSHFYEAGRQGTDLRAVNNGSYLTYKHQIRDEGRYLRMPTFVSEFGMFSHQKDHKDTNRIIAAMHQGQQSSDALKPGKDLFADAYSPPLSGTQWHWDWYHDRHQEKKNGNPNNVLSENDAWNDEDYSPFTVLADNSVRYNIDARNVERANVRATQGDTMAFHYNALVRDAYGTLLNWQAIRPLIGNREYFRNNRFALLTWRGRNSDAPTEVFLPREFTGDQIMVITDKRILNGMTSRSEPDHSQNEVMLTADTANGGNRLLVWDDADADESATSWHYALVVKREAGDGIDANLLPTIQQELNRTIVTGKLSPVYFTGAMTDGGYAPDYAPRDIKLSGSTYWFFGSWASFSWDGATGDVNILVNGKNVGSAAYKDSRSAWQYWGKTTYQVCEKGGRRCSNIWTVQ